MKIKKSFRKVVSCALAFMLALSVFIVPTTISATAESSGTAMQTWDFSTLKSSDSSETGENIKTITNADGTILSKNPNSGTIGGFWIDNNAIIASGQDPKALVRLNLKLSDNLVKGRKYKFNLGVYTAFGSGWPDASQIRLFYAPSALTYPEACQFNTDWTDKIPDSAELLCKLSYAKNIPTETDNVIEMSFTAEKDYSDGYLIVWFNGSYGKYHRFAFYSASLNDVTPTAVFMNGDTVVDTLAYAKIAAPTAPDMGDFAFIGWTADNNKVYDAADVIEIENDTVFHAVGIKMNTLDEASIRWSGTDAKRGLRFYTEVIFNDDAYHGCVSPAKVGAKIKMKDGAKVTDVANSLDGGNNQWNGSDGNGKYWFYSSLTEFATEFGQEQLNTVFQANGYATVIYADGNEKTVEAGYNEGRAMTAVAQQVLNNSADLTKQQIMLLTELYGAVIK